jgi:hypothetical protein
MAWPLDFSTAAIAESAVEEDFPLAVFAEKPLLLLKFLCYGDSVGPRFSGNREESDMLLYAAVSSKSCRLRWGVSQYHSKTPTEDYHYAAYCRFFR